MLQRSGGRLSLGPLLEAICSKSLVPQLPGCNASNPHWPFLSLTEYGREVVEEGRLTPADPEGFLNRLQEAYPKLSGDITMYVAEALNAFNRRLYLAAVVMLGVAVEGMMYDLANAVRSSFQDPQSGEDWYHQRITDRPALQVHRGIMGRLSSIQGDIPRHIRERFDAHLRGSTV